jgi:hypothetical protein
MAALAGAGVGAALGGLTGGLVGMGIPESTRPNATREKSKRAKC